VTYYTRAIQLPQQSLTPELSLKLLNNLGVTYHVLLNGASLTFKRLSKFTLHAEMMDRVEALLLEHPDLAEKISSGAIPYATESTTSDNTEREERQHCNSEEAEETSTLDKEDKDEDEVEEGSKESLAVYREIQNILKDPSMLRGRGV
jgi:hypothetical protein